MTFEPANLDLNIIELRGLYYWTTGDAGHTGIIYTKSTRYLDDTRYDTLHGSRPNLDDIIRLLLTAGFELCPPPCLAFRLEMSVRRDMSEHRGKHMTNITDHVPKAPDV